MKKSQKCQSCQIAPVKNSHTLNFAHSFFVIQKVSYKFQRYLLNLFVERAIISVSMMELII